MSLQIVVTSNRWKNDPIAREVVDYLQANDAALHIDNAIIYYDFPSYSDYETSVFRPDLLLFSPEHGFVPLRFCDKTLFQRSPDEVDELAEDLDDFSGNLHSRLVRSRVLRKSRTSTIVDINPVILSLGVDEPNDDDDIDCTVCNSLDSFAQFLRDIRHEQLAANVVREVRSIVEGAKALARTSKRRVEDRDRDVLAAALSDIEGQIANFDEIQRHIALVDVGGPARIRGLAGTGKTVILAMKAAHLHLNDPEAKILFTFYTKSLRATIKTLITKFFRLYSDEDPNWKVVHVRHGWGGSSYPGVYSDACRRANVIPMSFGAAQRAVGFGETPFGAICRKLMDSEEIDQFYDHVLIDEGQDFPDSFYQLAFKLTKGERDRKSIVWAYDELQDIMNIHLRQPRELFGVDRDGQPNVDLDRTLGNVPPGATNDAVLKRAYRNQLDVLVSAHALGFGIYGEIVQMVESADHWQDLGYQVNTGELVIGENVEVTRPADNSPLSIPPVDGVAIIDYFAGDSFDEEVGWLVHEVEKFLDGGLEAEDIVIVTLDDRHAKSYFKALSLALAKRDIATNNLSADPYNEPPFSIAGKVTLSTVYRAKGNEAPVVLAIGVDAVELKSRDGRNKIFTAFTRTKCWLRVSGVGDKARKVLDELETAVERSPTMTFVMPDPKKIDTIQRGFSRRQQAIIRAREQYIERLKEAGLSPEEIEEELRAGEGDE
ncbi:DEAD/DEAH box helicase [Thalassospira sp. A40-3]|uniref:DEAD/DEAH box helicase n=1 Tax=Thalassospira sp. A40-3 TaxID=2785908 RepID=UPI0018CCF8E8|nr:ATP-binding domain-containing protein [Thalassospira sp. A40-3]QPO13232.1 DEAD/DEAH box helicase [Thalassospira sp. A40-3]